MAPNLETTDTEMHPGGPHINNHAGKKKNKKKREKKITDGVNEDGARDIAPKIFRNPAIDFVKFYPPIFLAPYICFFILKLRKKHVFWLVLGRHIPLHDAVLTEMAA